MKEFYQKLVNEKKSYRDMIEFCCDSLILNNYIQPELSKKGLYFDTYCGNDYDEETDECVDVYQTYIISSGDAERLAAYTNEIVYYNEDLDLYLLAVTHWGTPWIGVDANWKNIDEMGY